MKPFPTAVALLSGFTLLTAPLSWATHLVPSFETADRVVAFSEAENANSTIDLGAAAASQVLSITVDVPNGGEIWDAGSTRFIRWHSNGVTGLVKLEYSVNNGGDYQTIAASADNSGTYTWIVPDTPTTTALVRISDASTGGVFDVSDGAFAILGTPSTLTVDVPNGGESWNEGSTRFIRWHSSGVSGPVKLEYSVNNGTDYETIAASADNSGTYTWIVPNTPTAAALVRISDVATGNVVDVSDGTFEITASLPTLTVDVPNGGEMWAADEPRVIRWHTENYFGQIKIELSADGGATYSTVVDSAPDTGTYEWIVPYTKTGQGLIRIADPADANLFDVSDAFFTITTPLLPLEITVTSPDGGEEWPVGSVRSIEWTSVNFTDPVDIQYTVDGGTVWQPIVSDAQNTGVYEWTVPDTPSERCRVRISAANGANPSDESDGDFSILTAPEDLLIVTNTDDSGPGSLRDAFTRANTHVGTDSIRFAIPEGASGHDPVNGVWTIMISTELPVIADDGLVIDGGSQARFVGYDANPNGPEIVIDGVLTGENVIGIAVRTDEVQVHALVINRFDGAAVSFYATQSGQIADSYLGVDHSGQKAAGNRHGVHLLENTRNVSIGVAGKPNVISGNHSANVFIQGGSANNLVIGNFIGLTIDGERLLGNGTGIAIQSSNGNELRENHIGGNSNGIQVYESTGTFIADNLIGTDATWKKDLGNTEDGIRLSGGAQGTTVFRNLIGYNAAHGVSVQGSTTLRNTVSENSIARNEVSGITTEYGGNGELTPPVIESATNVEVSGTAIPGNLVEVFGDDGSQGQHFLGAAIADNAGQFSLTFTSTPPSVSFCTATATDTDGNTSAFSAAHLMSGVGVQSELSAPTEFELYPSYPNPVSTATTIRYAVPVHAHVELTVYDVSGRAVRVLESKMRAPGEYEVSLDADRVAPGVYFLRMRAGIFARTRRLILLR